ncbi:hypothetical protein [Pantoea endophytica]|uniref:hypothetical protein n=1 Tax=Pantoea endophytica TaxID=92488 RepID=UPI000A8A1BC6|nr:hypothetical protein [Pantoea endophytica]
MNYAIAGDAIVARPSFNTSVTNQFAFKLTGADVMGWKPKSLLQQLVDFLRSKGQP